MKTSPQSRDNSKATPLQRVLLFSSLGALFLVAVGAEEPGEASCRPEGECQIIFNPESLTGTRQLKLNELKEVEVRLRCEGEEREATWRVVGFDGLFLRSALINDMICKDVAAPCVQVSVKAKDQFDEDDIDRIETNLTVSTEHPEAWLACLAFEGVRTDDPIDFVLYSANDAQVTVKASFTDEDGESRTVKRSLIVSVSLAELLTSAEMDLPLEASLETPP